MEDQLLHRLDAILVSLETKSAPTVWSLSYIAEWLDLSEQTIRKSIVCRPNFPIPIQTTGSREGCKRWFADEVVEWCRKNRGTVPQGRAGRRRGPLKIAA